MWQKRESPKGHRHRPLFLEIQYGGRALFPQLAATGVDGLSACDVCPLEAHLEVFFLAAFLKKRI